MIGTSNSLFWLSPLVPVALGVDKWYSPVEGYLNANQALSKDGSDYVSELFDLIDGSTPFEQATGSDQPKWINTNRLDFDGVNDYLGSSDSYFNFGDNDFMIMANVNINVDASAGIVAKWHTTSNKRCYLLQYYAGGEFRFYVDPDGLGTSYVMVSVTGINLSTDYTVACYHDSINNQIGIRSNKGAWQTLSYSGGVNTADNDCLIAKAGVGSTLSCEIGNVFFISSILDDTKLDRLVDYGF